jgi:hypothetical protein
MLKKPLLIGIAVVASLAIVLAIVVSPRLAHASAIETKAIGVWQETDSPQAYRLEICRDPGNPKGVTYAVTYPRSFKVPFSAYLSGSEIHIWGENTGDVVWVVTYDEKSDTLTLARPGEWSEQHTLKRISD